MKRKLLSTLLIISLVLSMLTVPGYALQDPIIFTSDSVVYGEGQNTLIIKGWFVNTSDKTVLSISDVQLEITAGDTVVASGVVDVSKTKSVSIAVGDAVAWTCILPNPQKNVDLSNYNVESLIAYNLGQSDKLALGKKVYYKGFPVEFDVKPSVIGGRLMIPARAVFEKMNGNVAWNDASKSLEVTRGNTTVIIFIDNPIITVNGTPVKLDVPATIVNGRTLVPLRAISNALGARIIYGELNEMAVIYE